MRWSSPHSLYTSPEWANLKALLLLERGDTCECGCGQVFLGAWDCIPHHIVEVTPLNVNDTTVSLNPDNIMLLRHACHNRIHERFGSCVRKVYLVWGAPCAGKSTFVREAAHTDDLIVDMDALWDAVCIEGREGKPSRITSEVFALRDALYDRIRMRAGKWRSAWVIATLPLKGERGRVAQMLGAEPVHVDTDRDTCLGRCGHDDRRRGWVVDYFDRLQPDTDSPLSDGSTTPHPSASEGGEGTVEGT